MFSPSVAACPPALPDALASRVRRPRICRVRSRRHAHGPAVRPSKWQPLRRTLSIADSVAVSLPVYRVGGLRDVPQWRVRVHSGPPRPRDAPDVVRSSGRTVEILGPTGSLGDIAIDPDGRRVLFDRDRARPESATSGSWTWSGESRLGSRPTRPMSSRASGFTDGKSIVYTAESGGMLQLRRRELATGRVQALFPRESHRRPETACPGASNSCTGRGDRGDMDETAGFSVGRPEDPRRCSKRRTTTGRFDSRPTVDTSSSFRTNRAATRPTSLRSRPRARRFESLLEG